MERGRLKLPRFQLPVLQWGLTGSITYAVDGKQYLAVPVGVGAQGWANSIPRSLTPEIKRPNAGNAVFVYTLPDAAGQTHE